MIWGDPEFSAVLLAMWLGMLSVLWGALLLSVGGWHRKFALPPSDEVELPRLTICIPAREEAHQVGDCVRAALAQSHPSFEVIVVDDCSTDGTGDVAREAGAGDARLRVVSGTPPPFGWAGKPWACARAAAEATGSQLLFIDADVLLQPDAARRAAGVLNHRHLGLLSLFGSWRLVGFWEHVAIPVIGWFIRGAVDVAAVNRAGSPAAFANGQFILVDRAAYDSMEGHGAVRSEVLEDVRLARAFKQRGWPIGLYSAPEAFAVRLYRSLPEIFTGYTKNFYEGMDRRPLLALGALLFLLIAGVLPYFGLLAAILRPALLFTGLDPWWPWQVWFAFDCALPIAFRWRIERADGRSGALAWTHPLGNAVLAAVLLASIFRVRTDWKGRSFHDGRAAENPPS